jgi:hypothetical protein
LVTLVKRICAAILAVFSAINQCLPSSCQNFFSSFYFPSSEETKQRSLLHDRVRYRDWRYLAVNAAYFGGRTALQACIDRQPYQIPSNAPMLGSLDNQNLDIRNVKEIDGATPLHAAVLELYGYNNPWFNGDYTREVKMLLDAGCDVNAKEMRGQTAMHWAAAEGNVIMVQFLQRHGADIYAKDDRQKTPLHRAAKYGHVDIVAALLAIAQANNQQVEADSATAYLEARDAKGRTAYYIAVLNGRREVAGLLSSIGANTEVTNVDGRHVSTVVGRAGFWAFVRSCLGSQIYGYQLDVARREAIMQKNSHRIHTL